MSQDAAYQDAYQQGERFLARGNFPLAKKAFEQAWQLQPNEALQAKIRLCAHAVEVQKRKEIIKQARHAEKRGKFHEALQRFEQAAALQEEDWLGQKINRLQGKMRLAQVERQNETAQANPHLDGALRPDDQRLERQPPPEMVRKQGPPLVR